MKDKISKFINVLKRDGFLKSMKKTFRYINTNYFSKISLKKRIDFITNKKRISMDLDKILNNNNYDRIFVWRGSFGWKVPLFQRPQQIALSLAKKRNLVLYEVTNMTDSDVYFYKKEAENLYLINYDLVKFEELLFEKLKKKRKPKYLQIYSTCWDIQKEEIDKYTSNNFNVLYEYVDELSPVLAGTNELPKNVEQVHKYITTNLNTFVITTANNLFEDMVNKRKSKKNILMSTNGADVDHFKYVKDTKIEAMEKIKAEYKTIVGYYGALASWFDYDILKKLAIKNKNVAFVLIGIKYDTSFDKEKLEKIKNIIYLGKVNYQLLPEYSKYFDIAWIPFKINEITLSTNPIKLFEYMSLKKFIITSDMPECRKYKSAKIAKSENDYQELISNYRKYLTKDYYEILEKEANINSWDNKANEIIKFLSNKEVNKK